MNPLRNDFAIEGADGKKYPVRFDLGSFSIAQRKLGVKFYPLMEAPIWHEDEKDCYSNMQFCFAALCVGKPDLTLEWVAENFFTVERTNSTIDVLAQALRDFSRRLFKSQGLDLDEVEAKIAAEMQAQASTTSGPSESSGLASTPISSGV